MKKICFFLFTLIAVVACKKDKNQPNITPNKNPESEPIIIIEEFDTGDSIYSNEYLAAYPGSWWEYNDGATVNCSSWQKMPVFQKTINGDTTIIKKYYVTIPKLGNYFVFDKSKAYEAPEIDSSNITPYIQEITGQFYYHTNNFNNPSGYSTLEKISHGVIPNLQVGNQTFTDVLKIEEKSLVYYYDTNGGPYETKFLFYAKEIGLVRTIRQFVNGVPDTIDIVNYYIAPQ